MSNKGEFPLYSLTKFDLIQPFSLILARFKHGSR